MDEGRGDGGEREMALGHVAVRGGGFYGEGRLSARGFGGTGSSGTGARRRRAGSRGRRGNITYDGWMAAAVILPRIYYFSDKIERALQGH